MIEVVRELLKRKCRTDMFDEDGVLPIQTIWIEGDKRGFRKEPEANSWVPQEIKKMIIKATADEYLGEGYYKDGNSPHHYACIEGNLECIAGDDMLHRIGESYFKKRNYKRKTAFDLAQDCNSINRDAVVAFIQNMFDEAKAIQQAAMAAEKKLKFDSASIIQRISRGKQQRKRFKVIHDAWLESERIRLEAEAAEREREKNERERNAAIKLQRLLRGNLHRTVMQVRNQFLKELARQAFMLEEQRPYDECVRVLECDFREYYLGGVEASDMISEHLLDAAEAARAVLLARQERISQFEKDGKRFEVPVDYTKEGVWEQYKEVMARVKSENFDPSANQESWNTDGDVLTFHENKQYVAMEDLTEIVETTCNKGRECLAEEIEGCKELLLHTLREGSSAVKDVIPKLRPKNMMLIRNTRERKRIEKELLFLEGSVKHMQEIMIGEHPISSLSGEASTLDNLLQVKMSVKSRGEQQFISPIDMAVQKAKMCLRIDWEMMALLEDQARKEQQYLAYELRDEAKAIEKEVHGKLHDDGLEEEAELLATKWVRVLETGWRGMNGKRAIAALKKFAGALAATVGVPKEYSLALEKAAKAAEDALLAFASWATMEEEKAVWRDLREYVKNADDLQEDLAVQADSEEIGGFQLQRVASEAWQLSMALNEIGEQDRAEHLKQFGLDVRAKAQHKLEEEQVASYDESKRTNAEAQKFGADVVESYIKALATEEAMQVKELMETLEMAKNNVIVPSALEETAAGLRNVANVLREEEKLEVEMDEQLNDLDAGDIDTLDELADLVNAHRLAWLKEMQLTGELSQVYEDHFRKAFGARPASRCTTPGWPLQPWPESNLDVIGELVEESDEEYED